MLNIVSFLFVFKTFYSVLVHTLATSRVKMMHNPKKIARKRFLMSFCCIRFGTISKVSRNCTTRKGINVKNKKMAANINQND